MDILAVALGVPLGMGCAMLVITIVEKIKDNRKNRQR